MRRASLRAIIALVPLLTACLDHTTEAPDPNDLEVIKMSEDGGSYPPYSELPFVVRVVRENGKAPVPNQIINFVVTEGGGSVFAGAAVTDALGYGAEFWTLGGPGPQALEARAVSADGEKLVFATFTAMAEVPGPTIYYDEAEFLTASGAAATVTYPTPKALSAIPYVENGVTLASAGGFNNSVTDLTPVFVGNEFGVSGAENVDITLDVPVYAIGIWMQDGYEVGQVGNGPCPKVDSEFEFTFLASSDVVSTHIEDPAVDQAFFLGLISPQAIDRVEIREVGSAVNDLYDPFFNDTATTEIYTGS
jgi:hypothetical protein